MTKIIVFKGDLIATLAGHPINLGDRIVIRNHEDGYRVTFPLNHEAPPLYGSMAKIKQFFNSLVPLPKFAHPEESWREF